MEIPKDRRYTRTHEWVKIDGDIVTVGLTDFAQNELGEITYAELPESGTTVAKDESFGVVESVKAASDVYAPVSGEVIESNSAASDSPEVINTSPYADAWLIKVRVDDATQVESLMDAETYEQFVASSGH